MAYPTAPNWVLADNLIAAQPITVTSTTQKHPIGTTIKAVDVGTTALGEAEFIYMPGVASTLAGDACILNQKAGTTARAVHSTAARGMLGIAMSANIANQWGWYMICGAGPIASTTGTTGNAVYLTSTAGTTDSVDVATDRVDGAWYVATGSGGFSYAQINGPFAHGSGGD